MTSSNPNSLPDGFRFSSEEAQRLLKAVRTILRGFDERVFVRSTDGDHNPAWAIKLFPFIQALAVAQEFVGSGCLGDDCPIHGGPNPEGL